MSSAARTRLAQRRGLSLSAARTLGRLAELMHADARARGGGAVPSKKSPNLKRQNDLKSDIPTW